MAVAALAMVGCSSEDDILNNETANELVSIASVAVDGQTTRAINSQNKLEDAKLLFYIDDADSKYNADGELWEHTAADGWKFISTHFDNTQAYWKGGTVTWRAASIGDVNPLRPENNPEYQIASSFTNEPMLEFNDLLWGMGTSSTKDFDITLQHALSKLTVNINKGTAFDGDEIRDVDVLDCSVKFTNKVNTANNLSEVAVPVPGAAKISVNMCKLSNTAAGYEESYAALILPQSFGAENFVVKIATNTDVCYTYTSESPVTFEAGKSYTLNLQVAQDKVLAGTITAAPWTAVDAGTLETE